MAVRTFNGSTDTISASIGSCAGCTGPLTYAVLWKPLTDATNRQPIGLYTSAAAGQDIMFVLSGTFNLEILMTGGGDLSTVTNTVADGWSICVVSKTTGLVHPHHSKFALSGGGWTQAAATTNVLNDDAAVPGGTVRFAASSNCRMAVAAVWNVALSDVQVQALSTNLKTADWLNTSLVGTAPQGLWEFNQASTGTAIQDLTGGGANQSAITGTTVTTGDDPPGWTFGTGGGAVPITTFSVSDPAGFRIPGIH